MFSVYTKSKGLFFLDLKCTTAIFFNKIPDKQKTHTM